MEGGDDGEGVAVMSSDGSYRDILYGREHDDGNDLTKPCTFVGCGGAMHFKPRLNEAGAPHTLEWRWQATWLCKENPAHVEIATAADEREAARRR